MAHPALLLATTQASVLWAAEDSVSLPVECTADASQRVTAPGMHDGRVAQLTRTSFALPGYVHRVPGISLVLLQAWQAYFTLWKLPQPLRMQNADIAYLAFYRGTAEHGWVEGYQVWRW